MQGTDLKVNKQIEQTRLARQATAEFIGTALLLAAIVGSGIMAEELAGGNTAIALLANTLATAAVLVALILALGPVSGAHFNPAVTLVDAWQGGLPSAAVPVYILAQIAGAITGVILANIMFDHPPVFLAEAVRTGPGLILGEFLATFGLLAVIWGCVRNGGSGVALAVGVYIASAIWFTSSTSFANPAVTIARSLSNTFTGIRPLDIPLFILAQLAGAFAATALFKWMIPSLPNRARDVVVSHERNETVASQK